MGWQQTAWESNTTFKLPPTESWCESRSDFCGAGRMIFWPITIQFTPSHWRYKNISRLPHPNKLYKLSVKSKLGLVGMSTRQDTQGSNPKTTDRKSRKAGGCKFNRKGHRALRSHTASAAAMLHACLRRVHASKASPDSLREQGQNNVGTQCLG